MIGILLVVLGCCGASQSAKPTNNRDAQKSSEDRTVTDPLSQGANSRLSSLLNAALRRVLGEATLTGVVREERTMLMTRVRDEIISRSSGERTPHMISLNWKW